MDEARGPDRSSLGGKLEPGRCRAGAAHDRRRSVRCAESCGSGSPQRASSPPRTAGATWDRRNRLSNAQACRHHDHPAAPRDGETGHCVHNMMRAPGDGRRPLPAEPPRRLALGRWRPQLGGHHGRAALDLRLPDPGASRAIRTRSGRCRSTATWPGAFRRMPPRPSGGLATAGEAGRALRNGLPQEAAIFTVLRQAMAGDARDPAGVYFGTNSGSVFASLDEGDNWQEIARHLPTILVSRGAGQERRLKAPWRGVAGVGGASPGRRPPYQASACSPAASTRIPATMSGIEENSSGVWLRPSFERTKIIATWRCRPSAG